MNKLSESYVAFMLEKNFLHPIPQGDVKQVLKDLLYVFVGTGNSWRDSNSNAMLHQEFELGFDSVSVSSLYDEI